MMPTSSRYEGLHAPRSAPCKLLVLEAQVNEVPLVLVNLVATPQEPFLGRCKGAAAQ